MKIAIIGAGWAGLAAAMEATLVGHQTIVFEASHSVGGRARALRVNLPNGAPLTLDNGQHILVGAYAETLRLMRLADVDPERALLGQPMTLLDPNRQGLQFPAWPTPWDALAAIVRARAWTLADKWSLLRRAAHWQHAGFQCDASQSVSQLCQGISPRVLADVISPLCLAALNTPLERASAQIFLRVLHDALFGAQGGSQLLLPRVNLSELFPNAAQRWINEHGGHLYLGARVTSVSQHDAQWQVHGAALPTSSALDNCFDAVIFAATATESARTLENSTATATGSLARSLHQWAQIAPSLQFEAITTVYAWGAGGALAHPMLRLRSGATAPAQFVFDRGRLGGPQGLLAFVISASNGERETLTANVLEQARQQLGLRLQELQTIVEKHATFACTPNLLRPAQTIVPGLFACGDFVAGPYPATLEGAVRSGVAAVKAATTGVYDATLKHTKTKMQSP